MLASGIKDVVDDKCFCLGSTRTVAQRNFDGVDATLLRRAEFGVNIKLRGFRSAQQGDPECTCDGAKDPTKTVAKPVQKLKQFMGFTNNNLGPFHATT